MHRFLPLFMFLFILYWGGAQNVIFHDEFSECIEKIAIDEDNDVLWMGTGLSSGGQLFMRDENGIRTDISELTNDINFQSITALWMDEATLYAGGYSGVAIIDPESEEYTQYTPSNSEYNNSNVPSTLVFDYNSEKLYAGNFSTSIDVLDENGWTNDNSLQRVLASTFDYEEDILWLATSNGELIRIIGDEKTVFNNSNSTIPNLPYIDMTVDLEGNIYLLVSDNGFVHFNGTQATHYTPQNSDLFGGNLNSIDIDNNGKVWFGHNGGITSFKNGNFHTYPLENYLGFFTHVQDIVVDNENHLWLGSCAGLIEFNLEPNSTKETDINQTNVFPNPTTGTFVFSTQEKGCLSIYNLVGEMVTSSTLNKGNNAIGLDLPSGHYAYIFRSTSFVESGKLNISK
ncbi:MAG: T9SS type A sorting domain-containing protein [Saprospiraceae bacterium]|nr:T9SS type A sorting domain-containing protein [Saprospiraceae bacterium]